MSEQDLFVRISLIPECSIYLVRLGLSSYYGYRTSRIQAQLDDLQKQRDATIEKLKTATKYNSTQELLQKYGGTPTPKVKSKEGSDQKNSPRQNGPKSSSGTRTSFIPPPTANISRLNDPNSMQPSPQQRPPSYPPTPISQANSPSSPYAQAPTQRPRLLSDASAEFAPNAFASAPQYSHGDSGPRWYDRIMDVLLGEDETRPGARFALICAECRLVNGQAPPGVKTLEDLGRWRCEGCGTMNGEESQAKKIVASIRKEQTSSKGTEEARIQERPRIAAKITSEEPEPPSAEDEETDITQYFSEEEEQEAEESNEEASKPTTESEAPRRRSTRPTKGKKTAG